MTKSIQSEFSAERLMEKSISTFDGNNIGEENRHQENDTVKENRQNINNHSKRSTTPDTFSCVISASAIIILITYRWNTYSSVKLF